MWRRAAPPSEGIQAGWRKGPKGASRNKTSIAPEKEESQTPTHAEDWRTGRDHWSIFLEWHHIWRHWKVHIRTDIPVYTVFGHIPLSFGMAGSNTTFTRLFWVAQGTTPLKFIMKWKEANKATVLESFTALRSFSHMCLSAHAKAQVHT